MAFTVFCSKVRTAKLAVPQLTLVRPLHGASAEVRLGSPTLLVTPSLDSGDGGAETSAETVPYG